MPLDPGTQYFALGDSNAGAQPADPSALSSSILGIDPALDLQSAGAQAAPAAGQGLAALVSLLSHLSAPPQTSPTLAPSAMSAGGAAGAAAGSPHADPLALGGTLGALLAGSPAAPASASPAPLVPMAGQAQVAAVPTPNAAVPTPNAAVPAPSAPPGGMAALQAMLAPQPSAPMAADIADGGSAGATLGALMAGAGGQPAASASPNAPLTMPTMPKRNNTIAQIFGALSALSGGAGGRIVSAGLAQQKAADTDRYNQQVQAYQQQQHDQQQQNQNNQQVNENQGGFVANLAKLDPATQQQIVSSMTPQVMAANGYTPATLRAQFYDKSGAFVPVSAADKPDNPVMLARAQTAARTSLQHLTTAGQQAYHDSFKDNPDDWVQQTGLHYEGFTPSETARDQTAGGTLAEKINNDAAVSGAKLSDAQNNSLKTLTAGTLPVQTAVYQSYAHDPAGFEAKYGVPYAGYKPGMTQANATALLATNNREADAQRTDETKVSLAKLNIAARAQIDHANNVVAMRGQDLRTQLGQHQINSRVQMFNQRYGQGNGNAAEKQYQGLLKTDMQIQKRMTVLGTPGKDTITDQPTLSLRDQGRIDANGNAVANPVATPAYEEYMQLVQYDQQLQQQMKAMTTPVSPALSASPGLSALSAQLGGVPLTGAGPLAPAPVTLDGHTRLPPGSPVPAPRVSPLPTFPAYTSHGSGLAALSRITNPQPQSAPQRVQPMPKMQPMPPMKPANVGYIVDQNKRPLFAMPTTAADYAKLTFQQKQMLVRVMRPHALK